MWKTGHFKFGTRMKRHLIALTTAALLLHHSAIAPAESETSIVVVVHKDSPLTPISQHEVVDLFLGKYKSSHNVQVKPLDNKDGALRDRFYSAVANMSAMRVKAYWSRIVFSGQGRPPHEISSAEAGSWLTNDTGALTYLPLNQVGDDMKIIFRVP